MLATQTTISSSAVTLVTASDFPGLNTLGLSIARTDLEIDGLVMPHSHPRASELFFVFKGMVIAGFVDTNNKLFQAVLKPGDVFVFPRGLLHFCFNSGYEFATIFSVFNSQNPGVVGISDAMFMSDFDTINNLVRKFISDSALNDSGIRNAIFSRLNDLQS
ncbi:Germin [Melia azedarach]|uniref:Germin n=1 Tax=Melia azedarach TaxID=155640 RepID=A0ACC1YZM5_MELAZ|nr:Germin [Melia azedarach]